ncbi:hypothetical protein MPER_13060 [Moniliophthora perniciosa FA553]|nr:hypothetical protein MPER_13060 [Moniliophthora perniciosa FA553]
MAPVRLRHPKGVATIQVSFEDAGVTVQDLQQEIYAATEILPSRQLLKTGYPPRSLTLIPELPLSSLGLMQGDQLIVAEDTSDPASNKPAPASRSTAAAIPSSSVPASAPSRSKVSSQRASSDPEHVETDDGGFLVHRVVPDDNSCLFSSVALIFEQEISKASRLRQVVAESIQKDPETYNEAILGMPPSKYIATIQKPSTWGGAIELTILAAHYRTEICSIDVETGRIDHFAPGTDAADMRCIVIYSGIHYDAATLAPSADAPAEWHQTVFPVKSLSDNSDGILVAGKKLADQLRAKKAYTNTATFDLKCEGLKGEKEARAHAEQTGHVRFGEY